MKNKIIYEKKEFLNPDIDDRSLIIAEVYFKDAPNRIDAALTLYDRFGDNFCLDLGFSSHKQYREAMRSLDNIKETIDELRVKMREAEELLETFRWG